MGKEDFENFVNELWKIPFRELKLNVKKGVYDNMVTKKDAGKGKDLWRLRLYLNKAAPKALRTETLLKGHLDVLLPGQYEIEILDVKSDIEKALADQIIATPTLIRLAPAPSKIL